MDRRLHDARGARMSILNWSEALAETLEDARLSRGERQALREVLAEALAQPGGVAAVRGRAFALAAEAIQGEGATDVLAWLEGVMRLLQAPLDEEEEAQHVFESYFSPGTDCLHAILRELRGARRRVDICVYTITDDRISDALYGMARRGIALRVVGDAEKARDRGADMHALREAKVPVRLDRRAGHMHHKFMLVDEARLLTGSYNWTRAAERENRENVLVTTHPGLVQAYQREFESLWRD